MSLIDEALKRAQEASRREGEKPEARPWAPMPLPDAGLARRRRAIRIALAALAGLAAVLILVVGGRLIWNAAGRPRSESEKAAAGVVPAVPSPAPTLPETVVAAPPAARAVGSSAGAPSTPRPRPTRPAVTPAAGETAVQTTEPPAEAPHPRPVADGRTYIGAIDLPGGGRIELGGIVWSEDEPRALLNDRVVATDAYIEGYTVSRIEQNRVVLTRDGVTIYLALK